MDNETSLRERLKKKREELNISYKNIGDVVGVTKGSIHSSLSGKTKSLEVLESIREALDRIEADPGVLIIGKPGRKPNKAKTQSKQNKPVKTKKKEIIKMMLTDAILNHFSLSKDPFEAGAVAKKELWISPNFQGVLNHALAAANNKSFLLIHGESGAGKSLLVQELLKKLKSPRYQVIFISPLFVENYTQNYIAAEIIQELTGKMPPAAHRITARELVKAVQIAEDQKKKVTLVIDEAHQLHYDIMKSLKRFHEGLGVHASKLGIIMVGQPEIVGKLKAIDLREVKRRLTYTELDPFNARGGRNKEELIKDYIKTKIECSGGSMDLFPDDVVKAIAGRCKTPLEVNELCSYALYQAYNTAEKTVCKEIIDDI